MRKIYLKLIAITLALMLTVSVVLMGSYAWLALSQNPAAEGIQITIAGGNTVLVAADMAESVDGKTFHYPGLFSDTLNIAQCDSYDYLGTIAGMTPVSTADGINWYLPAYYDLRDEEVRNGSVLTGTLKDIETFALDDRLQHANLGVDEKKLIQAGNYVYLDFWAVSPDSNYTLRVSTGEDSDGSFVIDLMPAEKNSEGYCLMEDAMDASASLRVGFLVNPDTLIDGTMDRYQGSSAYSKMYTSLRGCYAESGGAYVYSSDYRFTIYEPNGDAHPGRDAQEGNYVITKPVGIVDNTVSLVDIRDRLTVQLKNRWEMGDPGQKSQIEQRFQTYLAGKTLEEVNEEEISLDFYREYLGAQVAPYVLTGPFVKNTGRLYEEAGMNLDSLIAEEGLSLPEGSSDAEATTVSRGDIYEDVVAADFLTEGFTAGATDDVYIVELEENIPQRIRMFIWLEGQDIDCINSVSASDIAINIELAGSNQEISE